MEIPQNIQHQLNQFQQLQQQAQAVKSLRKLLKEPKYLKPQETYLLKLNVTLL